VKNRKQEENKNICDLHFLCQMNVWSHFVTHNHHCWYYYSMAHIVITISLGNIAHIAGTSKLKGGMLHHLWKRCLKLFSHFASKHFEANKFMFPQGLKNMNKKVS
jgi:hypothetical protein